MSILHSESMMNTEVLEKQTISLMNTISDIGAATAVLNWDHRIVFLRLHVFFLLQNLANLHNFAHFLKTNS